MKKRSYKYIAQEPYCCVPACIQMILHRRYKEKFSFISQRKIGKELGLIIKDLTSKEKISEKEYGAHVNKGQINKFFKKYNILLQERFVKHNEVLSDDDFFLPNQLEYNLDIIVGFNYKKLYDEGKEVRHVSLVQEVETKYPFLIILMDPSDGSRKVEFRKLIEAIQNVEDGYWLIGTKEEHEKSKFSLY